ncbi:MAG TPA: ankyrin repeat domain-containing protein [Casimicrobiaceae bacterium]|nr:ankyrin repeat domain-containing protein [Casimicrobiaceae bacterium]
MRLIESVMALFIALALVHEADAQRRGPPPEATVRGPTVEDFVLAVLNDRTDEVRALLKYGLDPDTVGPDGFPVLVTAAREGSVGALDLLLKAGAKIDLGGVSGDNALMTAALKGHLDIVKRLRARGAALERPGWTPLIYAATGGHDDVVRYLLAEGANINAVSPNGTTALMMAIREDKYSTAVLLIDRGADVNRRNETGATALQWAERSGDRALIDRLRRGGAF